jgi:hypothetical protein
MLLGANRECQEVLQELRKLLREHVESCGSSWQKNSGTQNVRGASPSNPLGIKNLFLYFESVLHLPARGRNR